MSVAPSPSTARRPRAPGGSSSRGSEPAPTRTRRCPRSSGHAINPARELGPCITHYPLPVPERGTPRRSCAWTPMVRPLIGGALTALVHNAAS
ncbi:aquaporin [Streptomyces sp. CA-106110]|uniref:aquaporin n=1 Tax=Streptomyces sp. CA-106110 TaxID=3240044 RepID=UPI003D89F9EE